MNLERMRRVAALVEEVFDLPLAERERRLAAACGDDARLRAEVDALLGDQYASAADTVALPAIAAATAAMAAMAEAAFPSRRGRRVGAWVLEDEIGHGGMGAVYRARRADGLYEATAAIKFLRRGLAHPALTRRFFAERRILASLTHPGIARLLDGGTADDGSPFIVMELIEGLPIDRFCDEGDLGIADRLRLFLAVTDAVQHAHQALVIHRDLKPSNILVTAAGQPKLLDFGVAKLVGDDDGLETTGLGPLTPAFASPEQIRGLRPTVATDVYSLGLVLYRMLTGHLAFSVEGCTRAEIERRITTEEPARPSEAARALRPGAGAQLKGDLDNVLLLALRKEPERRYPSVEAFATDLRRYLGGLPVAARPATLGYRVGKFVGRHVAPVAGVTGGVLAVVGMSLFYARRVASERDSARAEARRAEQVTAFLQNIFTGADPTRARGDSLTLAQVVDEGRARLDTALAAEPRIKSRLLATLGTVYRNLGRLNTADSTYHAALRLSDSLDGRNAPLRATILSELARIAFRRADAERSSSDLRDALAIREHNGDSLGVAEVLMQRLTLLINARELDSARAALDRVFAIYGGGVTLDSTQYAAALDDRAIVESFSGRHQAAIRDARAALALWRRHAPANDSRLLGALSRLGIVYVNAGLPDSAAAAYRAGVALAERIFGPDNPATAHQLGVAGPDLATMGFPAEGLAMTKRALSIQQRISGPDSLDVAVMNVELGNVYQAMDSIEAALPYYRRAIAIYAKSPATSRISLFYAYYNLGVGLDTLGRHRGAQRALRRALALATALELPVQTAWSEQALGQSLSHSASTAEAERHLRRALALVDSTEGPRHVDASYMLESLVYLYGEEHRYTEAVPLYRRLVPLLQSTRYQKQPSRLAPVLGGYARALRAVHDTAAADSIAAWKEQLVAAGQPDSSSR